MEEVWKPIEGFDGRYEISNWGRLKSFAQNKSGKISLGAVDHKGYRTVRLYKTPMNSIDYKVHRLVAEAFIVNPNGYEQVNHKDENKSNNHIDNLEWCTNQYNANYGTRSQRAGEANRCCPTTSLAVMSVDSSGNIEVFESIGEAERQTGLSHSNIVRTLKGRTRSCGGKTWHYIHS